MTVPYFAAPDTFAYQMGTRPLTQRVDFSEVPCSAISEEFKDGTFSGPMAVPESEALWFYLMNHAVARVREKVSPHEPLGENLWILEAYHEQLATRAVRLFRYLLLICTREARHGSSPMSGHWTSLSDKYPKPLISWVKQGFGLDSEEAASRFQEKPPPGPIGLYVELLRDVFLYGSWSGGYGGKKWAAITDCLCKTISGEYSPEMMMDTGWTLSHNNGPIFNKGMLYEHYDHSAILMVLDVQRSGQIPQLIWEACIGSSTKTSVGHMSNYMPSELRTMLHNLNKQLGLVPPDKPYVDWGLVTELGGVGDWSHQKDHQKKYWGPQTEPITTDTPQLLSTAILEAKNKADGFSELWDVFPGESYKKFKPVRQAA